MRKLQTTLTRIFIVLESESHGLFDFSRFILKIEMEISAQIGNSNAFSAQKLVISEKKKKEVFTEIETDFLVNNRKFKRFFSLTSPQKKRSSSKLRRIFRPKSEIQTLFQAESRHLLLNFGTQFSLEGAVLIFSPKIGLKSTKNVLFCILYRPMGGRGSRPPWLRYCSALRQT